MVSILFTPEFIRAGSPRMVRLALLVAGFTSQPTPGQPCEATGAAKMYATTIEPWPPGGRLSGPDDSKNRMSAGLLMFTKQMWVVTGSSEQEPSDGRKPPVM